MTENNASPSGNITRRGLLLGGGAGLTLGAIAGVGGVLTAQSISDSQLNTADGMNSLADSTVPVPSRGEHQAGIDRPATPQRNGLVIVCDVAIDASRDTIGILLRSVGDLIDKLTDPDRADPLVVPDGPGDLTITIGLGPRLVSALDPKLPGAQELPRFTSDGNLPDHLRGGDLLIGVYSSDASALYSVAGAVLAAAPGATQRWAQPASRGNGTGTVVRNPLGYLDGIIVPKTKEEMRENVWITDGPAKGGTIAVIRRLQLDVSAFHSRTIDEQDNIIGRTRVDGVPLSGGTVDSEVNLLAKSPQGEYIIPARSHVRAAHPSFTRSALMLRRGYGYSNATAGGASEQGLLFMCFQKDLDVFVRTQQRMDEVDDLLQFTTLTASASFLIIPGRVDDEAFGASLMNNSGG